MTMTKTTSKSVSFSEFVSICDTLNLEEYSDDEMAACWYNDNEKKMVQEEIRRTLEIMGPAANIDDEDENDHICSRGLERINANTIKLRKRALKAVLKQQDIQKQDTPSYNHEERIAEVYSKKTQTAVEFARSMGYADQEWVAMTIAQEEMLLSRLKVFDLLQQKQLQQCWKNVSMFSTNILHKALKPSWSLL